MPVQDRTYVSAASVAFASRLPAQTWKSLSCRSPRHQGTLSAPAHIRARWRHETMTGASAYRLSPDDQDRRAPVVISPS